jgi:putative ABC transport system ATP-binding protein
MNNGAVVSAVELTKVYQRGSEQIRALDHVSFDVHAGEFLAIVGPSGSGKSTLLNLVGCMDVPTSGGLKLMGTPVETSSDKQRTRLRRKEIGFVFQHFGLLPTLTVEENVELPAFFAGRGKAETQALLEQVGLAHRRKHRPFELSGGEMQRAAIARALINRPKMLLADEPTGNLDTATGESIVSLFKELNKREGLTVLVVTHNPALAAAASRQIRLVDAGVSLRNGKALPSFYRPVPPGGSYQTKSRKGSDGLDVVEPSQPIKSAGSRLRLPARPWRTSWAAGFCPHGSL